MAKKFIIHIGPAKTGTSSLQEALFKNRQGLLENGYDFPGFGRHVHMQRLPGHHGIPDRLRQSGEVPAGVVEHLAQLPDERTFVFSSENFAHVPRGAIQAFVEALQPEEISIVYYARRWDHLLPSVWQELIKHGDSRPYLEFLNAQVTAPLASSYLNYTVALDNWSAVVGKEKIRIFAYDNIRAEGQGIVEHFCHHVLNMALPPEAEHRENPRQKVELTETLRMMNRLFFKAQPGTPAMRVALTQAQSAISEDLAKLETLYAPYKRQARLSAPFVFKHVERLLLRKYGACVENLGENDTLFGTFQMEPTAYINQDYLLEPGALESLRSLLTKIRAPRAHNTT